MAIVERGENIYLIRVYVGRDPITKSRIQINETFHGSFEEAERREQVLKDKARRGQAVRSPRMTVSKLVDHYLDATRNHRAETTQISIKHLFRLYVVPYIGSLQVTKVKPSDVQRLLDFLLIPRKVKANGKKK